MFYPILLLHIEEVLGGLRIHFFGISDSVPWCCMGVTRVKTLVQNSSHDLSPTNSVSCEELLTILLHLDHFNWLILYWIWISLTRCGVRILILRFVDSVFKLENSTCFLLYELCCLQFVTLIRSSLTFIFLC